MKWLITLCVFSLTLRAEPPPAKHSVNLFPVAHSADGKLAFKPPALSETALGELVASNGGTFPSSLEQLRDAFDKRYGKDRSFTGVVFFSGAPGYTDMEETRQLFLSPAGDLNIGAILRADGSIDVEFQSRNHFDPKLLDFGKFTIPKGVKPEPKFVPRGECITCHRPGGGGPIAVRNEWSGMLVRSPFSDSSFLHRFEAFYTVHKETNPELKKHLELLKTYGDKYVDLPEAKQLRWRGADVVAEPREFERRVFASNHVTLLHQLTEKVSPHERKRLVRSILASSVCGRLSSARLSEAIDDHILQLDDHDQLFQAMTFQNLQPEGTNKRFSELTADELVAMHAKKKRNRIKNAHPAETVLDESNFPKMLGSGGRSVPLFGENSYSPVGAEDIFKAYGASLLLDLEDPKGFCRSPEFEALVEEGKLPTERSIQPYVRKYRERMGKEAHVLGEAKSCQSCHHAKSDYPFSFDVESLSAWKERLLAKDKKVAAEADALRKRVLPKLENGSMPPKPYRSPLSREQMEILKQYLKSFD